jgi:iron complex outermembrane receptor protein
MKPKYLITLVVGWIALAVTPVPVVNAADGSPGATAQLTGQVSNAATQLYLEGAIVTVAGTNRATITDREGRYHFSGLPAVPTTLVVSYTGLNSQEIPVTLTPGQSRALDVALTSEIYTLGTVVVASVREGNAFALTQQRNAPNIKNVVSSDAFGNVADGNVGNLLQQLPGVVADYVGQDVRSVSIRGIGAGLSTVTMDGDQIASSQSAGGGRQFEFEQASLNLVETIELTKAATPDMDAASVGGNVNLVSKSAFDRAARRYFTYTIGGVYRPRFFTQASHWAKEPIDNIGPSLNFTYADRLGAKENLGILLTGTHHSQPGGSVDSGMVHQTTSMTEPYYTNSANVPRVSSAPRTRTSAGFKIDYKHSEHTVFSLNAAYNAFHENSDTRGMNLATTAAVANFRPGFTSRLTEILPNNNATSTITVSTADKSGATKLLSFFGRHRPRGWDIDYAASWSISNTYYESSPEDRHYKSRPKAIITLSMRNIGFIIDRTADLRWPKITQTAGPDIYNLANYSSLLATQLNITGEDEIGALRLNVKRSFALRFPTFVKIGGAHKNQHRQLAGSERRFDYIGTAASQTNFLDTTGKYSGDYNRDYRPPPFPNPFALARHLITDPQLWREDLAYASTSKNSKDRQIDETVSAMYAMGETRIGKLSILAGVRSEETRTDATGPVQVNGVYRPERVRREGSYRDFFPSVHFRHTPFAGLVARASYSNGIGRPAFEDLMPLETVNETTKVIAVRNTALRPQYADNYDLSVEYYFEPVGSLTAGVFQKDIRDFHFATTVDLDGTDSVYGQQYAGYRLSTRHNGGNARYRGLELGYQQMFTFLPGFWRGFGVYANYTRLATRGDYGGAIATTQVANMVPHMANFAITYISGKWNLRANAVWRDVTLNSPSTNVAATAWFSERLNVNLKTKYSVSERLAVYCDVENITGSTSDTFRGNKDRPLLSGITSPKIIVGITGRY